MSKYRLNLKAMKANSIARTAAIVIGGVYFLSSFPDQDGCTFKVLAKSTKTNSAGWPSSVTIEVTEPHGDDVNKPYYAPGTVHSVNAANLYLNRADASHAAKFGTKPEEGTLKLMSILTGLSTERLATICDKAPARLR
jgi:hypothetical protein